ncbi:MAG: hypothetical protein MJ095_09505 [Oscillospiraceae bacterium]|nr:hypothetical protein [Oscillospiraceae bacterium]
MSLFGKKKCCSCGENIVTIYRKKLPCGLLCEKCSHEISPFVKSIRFTDTEKLRDHMAYRKENAELLEKFQITRIIGEKTRIVIDDRNGLFLIADCDRWSDRQPDVIRFDQVTGFDEYIEAIESGDYYESSKGIATDLPEGYMTCNFSFTLTVDSPWFDVISMQINKDDLITDDINSSEYREYKKMLAEVRETFRPYYRSARKIS